MKITAVNVLIAANILMYLVQSAKPVIEVWLALWPLQVLPGDTASLFHFWQLVSYAFLHSIDNYAHLLSNMLGLWMFGAALEASLHAAWLLALYFASVLTAAVTQLLVPGLFGAPPAPVIGASGGVFGLLLAYAMLFPRNKVVLLILPIPMPAWLFATLYAGIELFTGVTGRLGNIAHFAHLGGMVGSFLVISQWRRTRAPA